MSSKGIELVAQERERQIKVKGWAKEHDKHHDCGQLADLAVCYALRGYWRARLPVAMINPFRFGVFKPEPNNRIRELTKAEALIVAEIDRLFNIERDVKDE